MNCNIEKYFTKVMKRIESSSTYEEGGDRGVRYVFQDGLIITYCGANKYNVSFKGEGVFSLSKKENLKKYQKMKDIIIERKKSDRLKILEQL